MHTHSHPDTEYKLSVQDVTDSSNSLDNAAAHMPMLKPTILLFILLSIILGLCYPLLMTGVGQVTMPNQANGSLIEKEGQLVGSALIGQPFDQPQYIWTRPSAAGDGYDATQSSGSNLGPLNPELASNVEAQVQKLKAIDDNTDSKQFNIFGEPHVNVLAVNLALDEISTLPVK